MELLSVDLLFEDRGMEGVGVAFDFEGKGCFTTGRLERLIGEEDRERSERTG